MRECDVCLHTKHGINVKTHQILRVLSKVSKEKKFQAEDTESPTVLYRLPVLQILCFHM